MPAKLTWRDGRTHRRAGLTSLCSTRFKRPIILSLEQVFLIHQNYRLQLQPASAACALFQSINIIKKFVCLLKLMDPSSRDGPS
jgi:hypothetical protein